MGIFSGEWNFGVSDSPIVDSPFVQQFDVGVGSLPPPAGDFMITESGDFMQLESGAGLMLLES